MKGNKACGVLSIYMEAVQAYGYCRSIYENSGKSMQ